MISFITPSFAVARHNGDGGNYRYGGVNTSSLDKDIVDEIPVPVLFGIEYADINPDFGDPRGGGTRSHEGEDMLAPLGAPIVSPTDAVVIKTGTGPSAGKYVYTANPGGEIFRYMHLDYIADIERGDKLDAGDFIGTVGDTGNAPDGAYHLHFEMRDKKNKAQDPYPRLEGTFTLKEKASFLRDILRDVKDEEEYAEFLVETYEDDFSQMLNKGYKLPRNIRDAMDDAGVVDTSKLEKQFDMLIDTIPTLLQSDIRTGDQSIQVALLQTYLLFRTEGPERDALATAGATGYYGPITAGVVRAYQKQKKITQTGMFDAGTRKKMK